MNKKLKIALALLVVILAYSYFSEDEPYQPPLATGGPIGGIVVEGGTDKPISGVHVVVLWQGVLEFSHTACFHSASAVTDAEGQYRIPAWQKRHPRGNIDRQRLSMYFYAVGYRRLELWKNTVPLDSNGEPYDQRDRWVRGPSVGKAPWKDTLEPENGTSEARIEYLVKRLGLPGCDSEDASEKSLIPFRKAVYSELKSLASTKEHDKLVDLFWFHVETLELGFEAAQDRYLNR